MVVSNSSSSSLTCVASGATNSGSTNVATVIVDGGPACAQVDGEGQVNILYVTVVVCAPGSTTNCQTIDHVQVDTGSYGLRLLSQALEPALASALPIVNESVSGQPLAECTQFADGYSWGPIKSADMQVAGEKASGIEVQVIGDPSYTEVPDACSSYGTQEDTVATFGANGILGVGPFVQDCGGGAMGCTTDQQNGLYYVCATTMSCTASTVSLAQQVSNPVASFTNSSNGIADNNGVIIELPQIAAAGQLSAQGSLIFGIDTESNNTMVATNVLFGDPTDGNIVTIYGNSTLPDSYIDSGSNGYFFQDSTLPACTINTGFYCPVSPTVRTATNEGATGTPQSMVSFTVGDVDTLNTSYAAFDELAGSLSSPGGGQQVPPTFDWGLPFFFGLNVYTAIACNQTGASCQTTSQGYGPYFAY